MPENETKSNRTEVRPMPDTVRTAGAETVRDTDMGTVIPKQKPIGGEVKKTVVKKRVPDTVRTAGEEDIMRTDD